MSAKDVFNIKNKKIQKMQFQDGVEFSYIIDKNQVQKDVKEARLKLQRKKKSEMLYRALNTILEFSSLLMIAFCTMGWIIVDIGQWGKISLILLAPIVLLICFTLRLQPTINGFGYNDYRYFLNNISLFGDLKSKEIQEIKIEKFEGFSGDVINFSYSTILSDNKIEKKIRNIKVIVSKDVKMPVLVFDRKEYYVPQGSAWDKNVIRCDNDVLIKSLEENKDDKRE